MSAYTASKHAFGAFSDSLRMEMAMFDIKVLFARLMF
jgi:short-subunit dehydrogenase